MQIQRRSILKACAVVPILLKVGFLNVAQAARWNQKAFKAKSLDDIIQALGGSSTTNSDKLKIIAPEIAENGSVVRIAVDSQVPNTKKLAILVEENPNMLSGIFTFSKDAEPFVGVNVKMAKTSKITTLALADGKWLTASKDVKVTLGGCGG